MFTLIVNGVVLLLLTFLPGAGLVWAATSSLSRTRYVAIAASPAITLGLAGGLQGWSSMLGLRWSAWRILTFDLLIVLAGVAARLVERRRHSVPGPGLADGVRAFWRQRGHDGAALLSGEVIELFGSWGMVGRLTHPPGWDAMNH